MNTKSNVLHEKAECLPIDQIDCGSSITSSLFSCIGGEMTSCNYKAFISATDHCTSEISDFLRANSTFPFLTLE